MARPVLLGDGAELERPGEPALVAEQLVQALARVRQEGREEHLEAVDRAQGDEEHRGGTLGVARRQRPGRLVAQVLVDLGREAHRLGERGAEAGALDQRADRLEAGLDRREQRAVAPRRAAPGSGTAPSKLR